jgi:hypothetical protein
LIALLAACSSPSQLQIEVLVERGTTWASSPAIATLAVDLQTGTGKQRVLETAATEGSTRMAPIEVEGACQLSIAGYDSAKRHVATGTSIPFLAADVVGYTLRIFVQRAGRAVALPGTLAGSPDGALVTVLGNRTLAVAATRTAAPALELYDLASYQPLSTRFTLSRPPASLLAQGDRVLLLDATHADWLDTTTTTFEQATLPSDALLGDLAGGRASINDSGEALLVGATRTDGAATRQVLVVGPEAMRVATLSGARLNAGATWVPGVGLAVCGGNTALAAIELLAPNSSTALPLASPADAADARACATLASGDVVVAGGKLADGTPAPTWVFDPKCTANCVPTLWPSPGEALASPQMAAIGSRALLIGQGASGTITAYELSISEAKAVPLPTARTTAALVLLPTGAIGIAGGANTIDQFVPNLD